MAHCTPLAQAPALIHQSLVMLLLIAMKMMSFEYSYMEKAQSIAVDTFSQCSSQHMLS